MDTNTWGINIRKAVLLVVSIMLTGELLVAGTCASPTALTVNASCSTTTVDNNATISAPASCSGTISKEEWYSFSGTAGTSYSVGFTNSGNSNPAIAIYTGTCGSQTLVACANNAGSGAGSSESVSFTASSTATYYVVIFNYGTGGAAGNMGGSIFVSSTANVIYQSTGTSTSTVCNAKFYDKNGPCYAQNTSGVTTQTICPSTAGQCVSVTFNSFNLLNGYDYLLVFDGNSATVNQFSGSPYTGTTAPGPFTATTSNTSGCLTFQYSTIGGNWSNGWDATVSCATCATAPSATTHDCGAATQVCNDASFTNNSNSSGSFQDLNLSNDGCLGVEHQSSWYSITVTATGTIALNITPSVATDYDFAIWGPLTSLSCPPTGSPIRCSYYAGNGNTGLGNGETTGTSEGSGGGGTVNGYVTAINGIAGESYLLLVDNYSGSTQPFTLDWTLTSGASLGCTPLPVELLNFSGKNLGNQNLLEWSTSSETNNNFFTLEHSYDASNFVEIAQVQGSGTTSIQHNYQAFDQHPYNGITYYRLGQTDFNGTKKYFGIISVENSAEMASMDNLHPNPTNDQVGFDFYAAQDGTLNIQLFDYTGKLVKDTQREIHAGKNSLELLLTELPVGMYSMKLNYDKTGYNEVRRLIKNQ